MQITIDLQNVDNKDINDAIIAKLNSFSKKDIEDLLSNENFKESITAAIYKYVKDILEYHSDSYSSTGYDYSGLTRDDVRNTLREKKQSVSQDIVTEYINNIIKDMGEDNFKESLVKVFPDATVMALTQYIAKNMDEIYTANFLSTVSNYRAAIVNKLNQPQ